jgi:hypothetical protein
MESEEILRGLAENQRALVEAVASLHKDNIELKSQLASKAPEKKTPDNEVSQDMKDFIADRAAKKV